MQTIKRILINMDPTREVQPALDRGIYLAKVYGASIQLFLAVYNRDILANLFFNEAQAEAAKQGFIQSQTRWLKTYQSQLEAEGIEHSLSVKWHKPLYEAIIEEALAANVDLVIKSTHPHPTINKVFFTPNDWQLMKSCPKPLILAKQESRNQYGNILCGIDPSIDSVKPKTLNTAIVNHGIALGKKLSSSVKVCHCYSPIEYQLWSDIGLGMGVGMGPSDFTMGEANYKEYVAELKMGLEKQFNQAVSDFELADAQRLLIEGYPERALPKLVKEHQIDLLVLGSIYHSGLVGSTAEKILDEVSCDILSVNVAQ